MNEERYTENERDGKRTQYGVQFYKIEDGVETAVRMDDLPDDYISGLIKMLEDDMVSRERIDRVYRNLFSLR